MKGFLCALSGLGGLVLRSAPWPPHLNPLFQIWINNPFLHIFANMDSIIQRQILPVAKQALKQFRALCITGPRQSGKTTLSKQLYKGKAYINFEDPSVQHQVEQDPKLFLQQFTNGAI